MKQSNKWIFGSVGLAICFYIGWFFPLLWLLWLVLVLVLVAVPNSAEKPVTTNVAATTYAQPVMEEEQQLYGAAAQLEALIRDEKNDKVREGLQTALDVLRAQVVAQPVVMELAPQPVMTEAEMRERKERQELQNTNIILYTASLLLVGAAALFIGFNEFAGPTVRFMTLLFVAVGFYVSGIKLHSSSVKLMPAATAFVGTGLALIPFVGLAFNSLVVNDPALSWWLTSLVGVAAFVIAVRQIRSVVMSYLTLAFVFSLATSTVSVLDTPFVWYFVAVVLTSTLLMYLAFKRPSWVPEEFKRPLEQNAHIAAPVVLVGSLMFAATFTSFEYAIISGVGALHYLVSALGFATDKTRFAYWIAGRALTVIFAATLTHYLTDSWMWTSFTLLVAGVLTHWYSIRMVRREKLEEIWLWASQALVVVSLTGWPEDSVSVSATLVILLILSLSQLYVMRRFEFALAATVAAAALPLTLLRGVIEPPVAYEAVGALTLVMAGAFLVGRWLLTPRHDSFQHAAALFYMVFIAETIVLGALGMQWMAFGTLMTLAAILLHLSSFVERQPTTTVVSNVMLVIGVFALYGQAFESYTWVPLSTGLTLGAIWYGLSWFHRRPEAVSVDDHPRSLIMAVSAISLLGLSALIAMFQTDQTIVAGALVGCLTAAVIAYEGTVRRKLIGYELAAYVATFSLQRLVAHVYPDASWLVYTHWWALTSGLVAYMYYQRTGDKNVAMARAIISLTLFSLPTGFSALIDGTGGYRTLFLLEHVALAVAGVAVNKRLAVIWGAVGIGLAVLYMLQGYTYLLLTLIALGLIGVAIWRLSNKD
jgi:hypothetical protein